VQVAELAGIYFLGISLEFSDWLVLWSQILTEYTVFSDELNPLDIVCLSHWMIYRTHSYAITIGGLLYYGHMLLFGSISGVLLEELHRLATAFGCTISSDNYLYHQTAILALIYFIYFAHNILRING